MKRWSKGGKTGFEYPVRGSLRRLAIEGTKAHEARDYPKRNRYFSLKAWQAGELRAQAWRS